MRVGASALTRRAGLALALGLSSWPSLARAEGSASVRWDPGKRTTSPVADEVHPSDESDAHDGAYGRFDGLFDAGLSAGGELGDGAAVSTRASLHYYFTAGIYASYSDALAGAIAGSSRLASLGVDLRPAFIPRWSKDMEGSSSLLDLTLDSISIGLGGFVRQPKDGAFGDRRGLELSFGLGVPLAAWAEGPWLGARSLLRWDDPWGAHARAATVTTQVTLGWHWMIGK